MTENLTQTWTCDGPACTEEVTEPANWITTSVMGAVDAEINDKYGSRHFHNEACLLAYVEA